MPDWRDPAAYAPLVGADRSFFAWEWLRRDPNYREAAAAALDPRGSLPVRARPERFGLVAFERAELAVPFARPFWRSDVHPYVLSAACSGPAPADDAFDLERLGSAARLLAGSGAEHLLISDGLRALRLDGCPGTFSAGPVCLRYLLAGLDSAERPLLTIRRFLALCRTGRFARSLHPVEARTRRWVLILRASDALAAGADQRLIASSLLSRSAGEPRWRDREPSIRSQAQRLVRAARSFASGGYYSLLG